MCVASRTYLANLLWNFLDTWPKQRNWDLSILRSGSTFRVLRISQLLTLSPSVTLWTLCIFPSLSFALGIYYSFSHFPRITTTVKIATKTNLKTDSFAALESSRFVTTERWSSCRTTFVLPICVPFSAFRFFPGRANSGFSGGSQKDFCSGGQKSQNFLSTTGDQENNLFCQTFLWENVKFQKRGRGQGRPCPHPPFHMLMPSTWTSSPAVV